MAARPDFSTELVPLADRLRVMQYVRVLLGVIAVAHAAAAPEAWAVGLPAVGLLAGVYVALTTVGYVVWGMWKGRGLTLFGAMLIADGIFLASLAALSGGVQSAAAYLVLPHCMMVALLASYRSAAKIALWHSLLAVAVYQAGLADLLPLPPQRPDPTAMIGLVTFTALTWLAALGTASFAAMNERELRRRKVDLEDLARMATALESVSAPQEVGTVLCDALADAYGFKRVRVLVAEGETLRPLEAKDAVLPVTLPLDRVVRAAWDTHATQLVTHADPLADPSLHAVAGESRNLLVTPLFADGRPIGVVVAEHGLRRGSRIERRVVAMVERFCGHASLALRNAWLVDELRQVAATDALTGVANRGTFEAALERELVRSAREQSSIALLMVDVDRFKTLNDTYGHRTGDEVLKSLASAIRRQCREYDIVARYGGEEFAVVLPGCTAQEAMGTAERIRLAVSDLTVGPRTTASIGVAATTAGALGAEELVRSADAALYDAKREGRNRVCRAAEPKVVS